ncbi:ATP11-domain-containing protein [Trametes versicolor FP-101664 SS1]|uniref:ATP11-domain-containing protein n=1 Tax=Trametes versicolor (strain FP-101664) TaxID=717944 RepID=UPI0004623164|nr:ATP11-domain-containing protein [Trametes versicolor FP-101664 SS1]EIW65008.1 ATP11-domain-containing protein [Trametes versicolor FP-101664 SS1]
MLSRRALSLAFRSRTALRTFSLSSVSRDAGLVSPQVNYEEKYAEKLRRRAQERGKSVEQLRAELKEQERQRRLQKAKEESSRTSGTSESPLPAKSSPDASSATLPPSVSAARKDSSPVKALSSIFNIEKILQAPHTPEQISVLWRAYHASRSGGTGRGYLCAALPVETYEKMLEVATKHPRFVIPVPRANAQLEEGSTQPAYEFYLMEWGFHGSPQEPSTSADIFARPKPSSNPQTSTILFTPLQEYKQRTSFATPYLVVTHYTDLAKTHGLVLLRGEITPSTASSPNVGAGEDNGRYMLSQQDAQLLAVHVQRFYLWSEGSEARAALLKAFHETPAEFKWEELLKHTDFAA